MKTIALLFVLVFATLAAQSQVNQKAPDFTVDLLGGGTYSLSDDEGKVVLIFFFGYGCPSCLAVAPKVKSDLFNTYSSNSDFAYVSIDAWNGNVTQVSQFVNSRSVPGKVGLKGQSVANALGSNYDRLLVIDKQGYVRHNTDNLAANDVDAVKGVLNTYLAMNPTSVDESSIEDQIKVFPVPASDELFVSFEKTQSGQLSLFDLTGKKVRSAEFNADQIDLQVSDLSRGVYMLQIDTKEGALNKKIVIQ